MKPTLQILVGAPVKGHEANALKKIHEHLFEKSISALILANFEVRGRQIDMFVITANLTTLLELKHVTAPLSGGVNGRWRIKSRSGAETVYPGQNPYSQAMGQKYALSDEMRRFEEISIVPKPLKDSFYREFEAVVCICPDIASGSNLTSGDIKVRVRGLPESLERICENKLPSSWKIANWYEFARSHLRLQEVSLGAAIDSRHYEAEGLLDDFTIRLSALMSEALPDMLPGEENEPYPEHSSFRLVGSSGVGKTVRLRRYALRLLSAGNIVLILQAKHYRSNFKALLQKCAAPALGKATVENLLHATASCGKEINLVIDGLNECPNTHLADLLLDVTAFVNKHSARFIIALHDDIDLPSHLECEEVRLAPPTLNQKKAAFGSHTVGHAQIDLDMLDAFDNLHDVMMAARCLPASPTTLLSRTKLFDLYVQFCLPHEHLTAATSLCRHMASKLTASYAMSCSMVDFEKEAESYLRKTGARLDTVDYVRNSPLVSDSLTDFSFAHEMILNYFFADHLYRKSEELQSLSSELKRPGRKSIISFLLPRIQNLEDLLQFLHSVSDTQTLRDVLESRCGQRCRDILLKSCQSILSEAACDCANVQVTFPRESADEFSVLATWPDFCGLQPQTDHQEALLFLIGERLDDTDFADPAASLLALTGHALANASNGAAETHNVDSLEMLNHVFHKSLFLRSQTDCPASILLSAWRSSKGFYADHSLNSAWAIALFKQLETASGAGRVFPLFSLCQQLARTTDVGIGILLGVFQQAWDTELPSVRAQALEMLQYSAHRLTDDQQSDVSRVRQVLDGLDASDLWLNSYLIDAMNAFRMIDAPISTSEATNEIRQLLDPSSPLSSEVAEIYPDGSPIAGRQHFAVGIISKMIEEIYQGVYYEAYSDLPDIEKVKLLNLAAPECTFFLNLTFILSELIKLGDPSSLPIFEAIVRRFPRNPGFLDQDAVGARVLAIIGCARLSDELVPLNERDEPSMKAWQICSEIIFRLERDPSQRAEIEDLWLTTRSEAASGIGDVLFMLSTCHGTSDFFDFSLLLRGYEVHVKAICEYSLTKLDDLVSAISNSGSDWNCKRRISFFFSVLHSIGDETSINVLEGFVGSAEWGEEAISTIKAIKVRIANSTLE